MICLKMDATNGSAVWAVSFGGTSNDDIGFGITSVGSDRVAVTGSFSGTATFGDIVLTSKGVNGDAFMGANDMFIAMVSVLTCLVASH